jgi:uncharacterized membrane protein YfcA
MIPAAGINDAGCNKHFSTVCGGAHKQKQEQEKAMMTHFLFFVATILAGAINALAGGGGLITFPLLMLVVTPVTADATLKNFLTLCMRGMAILVLAFESNVNWSYGVPMAIGGLVGGYIGGMISHRTNRTVIRSIVIGIGFAASVYYFWKLYSPAVLRAGAE